MNLEFQTSFPVSIQWPAKCKYTFVPVAGAWAAPFVAIMWHELLCEVRRASDATFLIRSRGRKNILLKPNNTILRYRISSHLNECAWKTQLI